MKLITTTIDDYKPMNKDIICFLSGEVTNYDDWQKEVINNINHPIYGKTDNLVIFDPKGEYTPAKYPNTKEQVDWKYRYLTNIDIFSIYFCNTPETESDQPVCFYELARYVGLMKQKYDDFPLRTIISCEYRFKKEKDVLDKINNISCHIPVCLNSNPQDHARRIIDAYVRLSKKDEYNNGGFLI